MKPDPLPTGIEQKLLNRASHWCAKCLRPIAAGMVCERVGGRATRVVAHCHSMRVVTVVLDTDAEDHDRIWHYLHDEGEPYVSPAQKRKEQLRAEVDRLRARRGDQ